MRVRVEQRNRGGFQFRGSRDTGGESALSHRLAERRHLSGGARRNEHRRAIAANHRQPQLRRGFLLCQILDCRRRSVPYDGQVIATARWIAPTLLLEYQFLSENSRWRPYIGAGVNYTTFYDRDSTAAGNAASGGPTKLSLTPSWGPAVTAGVIRTTRINFGPQALVLSVGYSF
jgi:hypothetical protein